MSVKSSVWLVIRVAVRDSPWATTSGSIPIEMSGRSWISYKKFPAPRQPSSSTARREAELIPSDEIIGLGQSVQLKSTEPLHWKLIYSAASNAISWISSPGQTGPLPSIVMGRGGLILTFTSALVGQCSVSSWRVITVDSEG